MMWVKFALLVIASAMLNAAFMFKAPEYAVISGVVFGFAIGME